VGPPWPQVVLFDLREILAVLPFPSFPCTQWTCGVKFALYHLNGKRWDETQHIPSQLRGDQGGMDDDVQPVSRINGWGILSGYVGVRPLTDLGMAVYRVWGPRGSPDFEKSGK